MPPKDERHRFSDYELRGMSAKIDDLLDWKDAHEREEASFHLEMKEQLSQVLENTKGIGPLMEAWKTFVYTGKGLSWFGHGLRWVIKVGGAITLILGGGYILLEWVATHFPHKG